MEINFAGKKALVTGAGKGIGRAIAVALAKGGADVYALSRTQEDLDSLAKEDPKLSCHLVELSNWQATEAVVESLGPIDLVVNNAGVASLEPALEVTQEAFDRVISINLRAPLQITQLCARTMIARGVPGSVVNISSAAGLVPLKDHTSYCSSKAGLDMMTKVLALELGPKQIRVNCVNPGVVNTDMAAFAWGDPLKRDAYLSRVPLGKFKEVEDVVNAVLFLLSDKSANISGITLPISGGFTMGGLNLPS